MPLGLKEEVKAKLQARQSGAERLHLIDPVRDDHGLPAGPPDDDPHHAGALTC